MKREEVIDILNGMCERYLMKGMITKLNDAKTLYEVFDRFRNNSYVNDDEYSGDILYLYKIAVNLHKSGNTSLEESYSLYNAILSADRIDFVETDVSVVEERIIKQEPVKIKKCKKSKANEDIDVVDVSDIVA
jgi:hypothetical protein